MYHRHGWLQGNWHWDRNGTGTPRAWARKIPPFTPCGYCFQEYAQVWDHIIPYRKGGSTKAANLMPACRRCNAILGDKVFSHIREKRDFIREVLQHREIWKAPENDEPYEFG
jgi:5-methylcytosine-specific restriction endonuclease McrA